MLSRILPMCIYPMSISVRKERVHVNPNKSVCVLTVFVPVRSAHMLEQEEPGPFRSYREENALEEKKHIKKKKRWL